MNARSYKEQEVTLKVRFVTPRREIGRDIQWRVEHIVMVVLDHPAVFQVRQVGNARELPFVFPPEKDALKPFVRDDGE